MKTMRHLLTTLFLAAALGTAGGPVLAAESADLSVKVSMCGSGLPCSGASVIVHRPATDETYNGTTGFGGVWSWSVDAPEQGEVLEFSLRRQGSSNEVEFEAEIELSGLLEDDYVIVFRPGCPEPCWPAGTCYVSNDGSQLLVHMQP